MIEVENLTKKFNPAIGAVALIFVGASASMKRRRGSK